MCQKDLDLAIRLSALSHEGHTVRYRRRSGAKYGRGIFLESFPFEVPLQHSLNTPLTPTLPEPSLARYDAFLFPSSRKISTNVVNTANKATYDED